MKKKLRDYIDQIFADAPDSARTREIKEEMYSNICDKFDDLIAEGKSEAAAYNISISGIGDISTLIAELQKDSEQKKEKASDPKGSQKKVYEFTEAEKKQVEKYRTRSGIITAVATALFILCWVPLVILAEISDSDLFGLIGITVMMLMIAAGVVLFIIKPYLKPECMRGKHIKDEDDEDDDDEDDDDEDDDDEDDDDEDDRAARKKTKKGKKHPVLTILQSVLWALTFIVYFLISFISGAWHLTWMLFLIAAAVDNIMEAIFALALHKGSKGVQITKLVIWSVVGSIMLSLLCGLSVDGGSSWSTNIGGFTIAGGSYYPNGDSYNVGNREYTEEIASIDLSWTAGKVNVVLYDGDRVKLEETGAGEEDQNKMRSRVVGGELMIQYVKSGLRFFASYPEKELTLYLPQDRALQRLKINAASADVFFDNALPENVFSIRYFDLNTASGILSVSEGFVFTNVDIDTASGDIAFRGKADALEVDAASADLNLTGDFGNADIDTASGDVTLHGTLDELEMDAVSGKAVLELQNVPRDLEIDGASCSVKLTLPSDAGFIANYDGASGHMICDGNRGDRFSIGDCYGKFEFSMASGNVEIVLK